ncbi:cytidylyltransferase domain-containing protein [Chloroflexota bacterium]
MSKKPNIIAIIPARGGSKGIPHKNIKLLNGKPLIYYTINEAKKSKYLCRLIVSTEESEIAEIAKGFKAEVIERPIELAQDDTPSLPVFQQVVKYLEEVGNFHPDIIVVLQPTTPLRTIEDIDGAIELFLNTDCNSVVSVCCVEHPPHWMYTLEEGRLKPLIKDEREITRRQDASITYRLNGAVYVIHRNILMEQNRVMDNNTRPFIMPLERSIDIDTDLDFKLAGLLMKERE